MGCIVKNYIAISICQFITKPITLLFHNCIQDKPKKKYPLNVFRYTLTGYPEFPYLLIDPVLNDKFDLFSCHAGDNTGRESQFPAYQNRLLHF